MQARGDEDPAVSLVRSRFTDPFAHPETAFTGSKQKLLKGLEGKAKERARRWLQQQEAFVITRPAPSGKGKFPRQKVITGDVGDCWELDLSDMGSNRDMLAQNDRYRYILVVVDQFSRFCMAEALKSKEGKEVSKAFDRILTRAGEARTPIKIFSDRGKEFLNHDFKAVWQRWGITEHYMPNDAETKCPHVERLIRTLKQMTTTYFIQNNTLRWVDMLPALVNSYNHTRHSSLGTSPIQVLHSEGQELEDQWQRQHGRGVNTKQYAMARRDLKAFKRGDMVRVATMKGHFEKGYTPKWQREVFRVGRVLYRHPRVAYRLVDLQGEPIEGIFYREQLQRHLGQPYAGRVIERVVADNGRGRVTLKFLGWGPKFNQTVTVDRYNEMLRRQNNRYGLNLNQQAQAQNQQPEPVAGPSHAPAT